MQSIRILLLRGNNLTGRIPRQLCDRLRNTHFLDLSNNRLSVDPYLHALAIRQLVWEKRIRHLFLISPLLPLKRPIVLLWKRLPFPEKFMSVHMSNLYLC